MADEIVTRQQLVDAGLDAESLQKFISGSDIEDVLTFGADLSTLAKTIRILMETGGWKAYSTEAELLATFQQLIHQSVMLSTRKLYKWNGTSWIDEGLSQLALAEKFFLQIKELSISLQLRNVYLVMQCMRMGILMWLILLQCFMFL